MADIKQKHAHIVRGKNGEICGVFECKKDRVLVYDYTNNILKLKNKSGEVIQVFNNLPKLKGIETFEGWVRIYTAEHNLY